MNSEKSMINVLHGGKTETLPFWFMRQAGRYLPEYRALREKAGGFLDMVYVPDRAVEVTMQPLRRYGMSAAILFSDILVVPHALGQDLSFVKGEGPKLSPIRHKDEIPVYEENRFHDVLSPVYETVSRLSRQIPAEGFHDTALIGFAGAPWTVACYMVEGQGSKEYHHPKSWAYNDPDGFEKLIRILTESTADYLTKQVEAGAEVLQIFDSWSGILDEYNFRKWVIEPTKTIIQRIRSRHITVPIIGFPRGAGKNYHDYIRETGVDAVSVDQFTPLSEMKKMQEHTIVQGNLDPVYLLGDPERMIVATDRILEEMKNDSRFIFNLGHGMIKEIAPENVDILCQHLRKS